MVLLPGQKAFLLDQMAGIFPKKLRKQGKSTFPLFDCHLPDISGKQNNLICVDRATRVFVNISDCRSPDDAVTEAWKKNNLDGSPCINPVDRNCKMNSPGKSFLTDSPSASLSSLNSYSTFFIFFQNEK